MAITAKQIMGARGEDVATVTPDEHLRDAAATLAERRIGAVVVLDTDRRVVGIVSERDIVRRLAADGESCLDLRVEEVMTGPVTTTDGRDTTERLMQIMTDGRFRHVPVTDDDDHLVGIVSVGDVVKATIEQLEVEKEALEGYVAGSY